MGDLRKSDAERRISAKAAAQEGVVSLGQAATISDESAAWDWGLLPKLTAPVHVTTAGHNRDRPGIKVHHRTRITPVDRDGLPVTSVAETLNTLPPNQLMRALREARYLGVLRPRELTGRAKRGWERISTVPPHRTRSELEHRLLDVCDTHGFPHPLVNHSVDGLERARP
jgi:hypothetical protein